MYTSINEFKETLNERKEYYIQDDIGTVKYSVSYYNGKKKNADGSKFYDFKTFSNRKKRDEFIKELKQKGYVERGINLSQIKEDKINEETENDKNNVNFYIGTAFVRIHKDSYDEGETDLVNSYYLDIKKEFTNIQDYLSNLGTNYPGIDFKLDNLIVFDNRLIYSALVDGDDNEIITNSEEYELWKIGEFEGFTIDIDVVVSVYIKQEITDSEEISKLLGVQNYD